MDELGITCTVVSSDAMNHAWNMVRVNGKWYHIDVTWDDHVSDTYGRVYHDYFMLSDSAISDDWHGHYDWYASHKATDTTYDSYIFACIGKPMQYYNGDWYWVQDYGSSNNCDGDDYKFVEAGLNKYSFDNNAVTTIIDSYDLVTQNIYNGYMYVITYDYELYMAPINNLSKLTLVKIANLTNLNELGKLDGFYLENGYLHYALADEKYYVFDEEAEEIRPLYDDYYKYRYFYSINLRNYKYRNNLCGNNLTWKLDSNGTLKIMGTGDMWDYSSDDVPWETDIDKINSIIFEDGITSIGSYAFYDCNNLISVEFSDSITTVNQYAFASCSGLIYIKLPKNITNIGKFAFLSCKNIKDVYYNNSEDIQKNIYIENGNTDLIKATIHYNSEFPNPKIDNVTFFSNANQYDFSISFDDIMYNCKLITVLYDRFGVYWSDK